MKGPTSCDAGLLGTLREAAAPHTPRDGERFQAPLVPHELMDPAQLLRFIYCSLKTPPQRLEKSCGWSREVKQTKP